MSIEHDAVAASDRLVAAYNAKDLDAMRELIAPDIDFAHFNRGAEIDTRDVLFDTLGLFATTLAPNRAYEAPVRVHTNGSTVIREAWWAATVEVDIPGFADAGQDVRFRLCSVHRFDEAGILVEWKDYG